MSDRNIARKARGIGLAALIVLSVLAVAVPASAAGTTAVSLSPSAASVDESNTTTFDVVVENADGGVGAHNFTVSVDPSVAEITDIQLAGNPSLSDVSFASDNSSVTSASSLADTADTGAVTIATVTVEGTASGTTGVDLTVNALGNESGNDYTVSSVNDATLTVKGPTLALAGGSATPDTVDESTTVSHDIGAVFENVSQDGTTDRFYFTFPDALAGNFSANSGNATSLADGSSVSISSSIGTVDGPDADGVMDTLTFAVSPDATGVVDVMANASVDITWPAVDANTTYTIQAAAEDSSTGNVSPTDIADVTVVDTTEPNQPPTADFTVEPAEPTVGETVAFMADASDPDGTVASYEWTVDGDAAGAGPSLEYTFETSGDHEVVLTVTDDDGATDTVRKTVMAASPATFEVSNLEAPASAVQGDTITVNATISNVGDVEGSVDAEFVFGRAVLLAQNQSLTLAGAESKNISFNVSTAGIDPGSYEYGLQAGDGFQNGEITIRQPATFEVSNLQAPASAVQGETITVNATVANVGDVAGSTDTFFVFDGALILNRTVALDPGNATDVRFQVSTAGVPVGTYEHGVAAGESFQSANITIQQPPTFAVSNLQAPANATAGETITVNATITNVGDVAGTGPAEFVFGGTPLLSQEVSLASGASTTVSFEVSTDGIASGTYVHGVRTADDAAAAEIGINAPPTADFTASAKTPEVNQTITLDASNSTDVDGSITSYEWDLDGDGNYDDATGPEVDTEFNATGSVTVGLRVTDDDGATDTATVSVNVTEQARRISTAQPGFEFAVAVLALLAVVLFARRRE